MNAFLTATNTPDTIISGTCPTFQPANTGRAGLRQMTPEQRKTYATLLDASREVFQDLAGMGTRVAGWNGEVDYYTPMSARRTGTGENLCFGPDGTLYFIFSRASQPYIEPLETLRQQILTEVRDATDAEVLLIIKVFMKLFLLFIFYDRIDVGTERRLVSKYIGTDLGAILRRSQAALTAEEGIAFFFMLAESKKKRRKETALFTWGSGVIVSTVLSLLVSSAAAACVLMKK